jgi:hypothetical protein
MNFLSSQRLLPAVGRRLRVATQWCVTVGLVWLCMTASSWAQQLQEEEPEEKTYVPSYLVIVFAVSFGLLVICRGGKRSAGFRREE